MFMRGEWIGPSPADCSNADYFEYGIREAMRSLFGEFGASVPLEVVSYEPARCRGKLRVPADAADRVTAALTLCSQLLGTPCVVHVHGQPAVEAAPKRYFCA
ncbi:ribonuclease P protein subunit p14-like isoform X2 [Pollicipes pollicipes]|uniref:ribonuclease P protein subunit p14-like isoform X2 n=1 Tax=Pollicipes pollicipes TaxID=41117 RepID=UPI001884C067|nr:ribonuclease P protein subunit p14-like isoform X2 [Pollicipes pollicipes]